MENPGGRRFWGRDHELHATAIGRALWRHVRGRGRAAAPPAISGGQAYEAAYDISRGYAEERSIGLVPEGGD